MAQGDVAEIEISHAGKTVRTTLDALERTAQRVRDEGLRPMRNTEIGEARITGLTFKTDKDGVRFARMTLEFETRECDPVALLDLQLVAASVALEELPQPQLSFPAPPASGQRVDEETGEILDGAEA